ncbi:sulfoxide reductase heme-binding subunit YedZ [Marinomonas agarivorans]|nr:sulfoxide reductase heme-binding subunit YedZ [Marinomonas agarivorans]
MWDRKEKKFVFVIFLLPFLWMIYSFLSGRYFPDPAEPFMTISGIWASLFLVLSISITPLVKIKRNLRVLNRYRRFVGLTAFWYSGCHLLAYLLLHAGFSFEWIIEDLTKRSYIYTGFFALLILFVLAITSMRVAVRKLGKYWKVIHRLVYLVPVLVLAHLWWQVKADYQIALWFTPLLLVPLFFRIKKLPKN